MTPITTPALFHAHLDANPDIITTVAELAAELAAAAKCATYAGRQTAAVACVVTWEALSDPVTYYLISTYMHNNYMGYNSRRAIERTLESNCATHTALKSIPRHSPTAGGYPDVLFTLTTSEASVLAPEVVSRLKRFRVERNFKATARSLSLDEFSLAVFSSYLSGLKRLTGTDAARYVKQLTAVSAITDAEAVIRDKYIRLLWDASTKSTALTKAVAKACRYRGYSPHMAIFVYNYNISNLPAASFTGDFIISFDFIKQAAIKYNIPLLLSVLDITESSVYHHVSGVPKSGALTRYDTIYLLDKYTVLHALRDMDSSNLHYTIALDTIALELARPECIEYLEATSTLRDRSTASAVATQKLIASVTNT